MAAQIRAVTELGLDLDGVERIDPAHSGKLEVYAEELYGLRNRRGVTRNEAELLLRNPNMFGSMMVNLGDADAMVAGISQHYPDTIRPALQIIRVKTDARVAGKVKVVMTGSAADPPEWQPHIANKARSKLLAKRCKDAEDPLKLVIVCDMWLTGFDAPSMHTMYLDKPLRGHGLMQAIARVNRVFRDKPAGLVRTISASRRT